MILVIGSGVAGLGCALAAAEAGVPVRLVTPGALRGAATAGDTAAAVDTDARRAGGSTAMAQGGIAAAIGAGDRPEDHAADTVLAGAGLVDAEAAEVLTREGAAAVRALIAGGLPVDRDASGAVALGLEAAHGRRRIVHAGGDRSGAALHAYLSARVLALVAAGRIALTEHHSVESLLGSAGLGAVLRDRSGALSVVRADAVVLATGGYAALYPRTSNHPATVGDGVVLAARAGALVADLEFVQFHPTVLVDEPTAGAGARAGDTGFLISEAVRGAGAVLRDGAGRRFMLDVDPAAELAPRDVVSRAVHRVLGARGEEAVWLDATGIEREGGTGALASRFPMIAAETAARGFDWTREPIPVAPAAHYTMGGIATDLDGRTSVPGLFAVGEVSSTGVHGANRLASNSLLEGLVFGARAGRAAAVFAGGQVAGAASTARAGAGEWELRGSGVRELAAGALPLARAGAAAVPEIAAPGPAFSGAAEVRKAVAEGLGIERDAAGIARAAKVFAAVTPTPSVGRLAELGAMIAAAAAHRTESRGAHQRSDHPGPDAGQARRQAWRLTGGAPDAAAIVAAAATSPDDHRPATAVAGEQRSFATC